MANTRFQNIILYSNTGFWRDVPQVVTTQHIVQMDDFTGVALDATNTWTVVKDTGASVGIVADTHGGELAITSAATTDNDGGSIQGNEIYLPAANRIIWFEARVKNTKVLETDLFFGLAENFATNPEAVLAVANRVGLQMDDGAATIITKTVAASTTTSTTTAFSMVDNTYATLGCKIIGTGIVEFYANGNLIASHTTNIPVTELTPCAFSLSGDNLSTRITTIDYMFSASTR